MIRIGDTLLLHGHLCVVLSDPQQNPDEIVLAAFTTWEGYKDQTCLLHPGDHGFIRHDTCVDYELVPQVPSVEQLERGIRAGRITPGEPVSRELIERILRGADETDRIPMERWRILDDQGLFEADPSSFGHLR